jgi:hypothetical protein
VGYFLENVESVPDSRCANVRYEDLCDRPNQVIGDLLDALGLVPPQPLDLAARVQPRKASVLPVISRNRARLGGRLDPYCRAMGYPLPTE